MAFFPLLFLFVYSKYEEINPQDVNDDGTTRNVDPIDFDDIETQKEAIRSQRRRLHTTMGDQRADFEMDPYNIYGPCDKPHSKKNFAKQCVCEDGYETTNIHELGCWKCEKKCHLQATCQPNGECQCIKGYEGDGVETCRSIPPKIVDISPQQISTSKLMEKPDIHITFLFDTFYTHEAYVDFGGRVVKTYDIRDSTITCPIPPYLRGSTKIRISFNNQDWSTTDIELQVKGELFDTENVFIAFIVCVLLITCARVIYLKYQQATKPGQMAKAPLILTKRRSARKRRNNRIQV